MGGAGEANHFWIRLGAGPPAVFRDDVQTVPLTVGSILVEAGQPTEYVHFVEAGLLSVGADGIGEGVEVGLVGREGLSGGWLALGRRISPFRVHVQTGGRASRVPAEAFRRACAGSAELEAAVLGYAGDFMAMVAETCRATARLTLEGRLARWLLMAHDRLDTDEIAITHDALARILGVRRPGVTVVLHVLEGERMVRASRGTIRILNRAKLGAVARGFYREAGPPRPASPGRAAPPV